MNKNVSDYGRSFIKKYEGLRTKSYLDVGGRATIGYGHLVTSGDIESGYFNVIQEMDDNGVTHKYYLITQRQADHLFDDDIELVRINLNRLIQDAGITDVSQGQFDALASFAFNLGIGRLAESTLWKKFKAGQYQDAANEFLKWVYVNKKKVKGLETRRKAECELFLS